MDILTLLIIVFILAPLLERLLGLGRPKQPPQGGPPQQQRMPGPRPQRRLPPEEEERPFRSIPSADADAERTAAEMLPDDLWEILTGEKRSPRQPPRPERERAQTGIETEARPERIDEERRPVDVSGHAPPPRPRTVDRRREEATARPQRTPAAPRRRPPAPPRERRLPEVTMRRDPGDTGFRRPQGGPPASPADDYIREVPVREPAAARSWDVTAMDPEERRARFKERKALMSEAPSIARAERPDLGLRGVENLRRAFIMTEVLGRPKGLPD